MFDLGNIHNDIECDRKRRHTGVEGNSRNAGPIGDRGVPLLRDLFLVNIRSVLEQEMRETYRRAQIYLHQQEGKMIRNAETDGDESCPSVGTLRDEAKI